MSPPYCFYLVPLSLIVSWLIAIPDLVGRDRIEPANLSLLPIILYNTYHLPGTAMTCFHRALALPLWNLNPLPRTFRSLLALMEVPATNHLYSLPPLHILAHRLSLGYLKGRLAFVGTLNFTIDPCLLDRDCMLDGTATLLHCPQ